MNGGLSHCCRDIITTATYPRLALPEQSVRGIGSCVSTGYAIICAASNVRLTIQLYILGFETRLC